ncbi:MAG: arylamine N-acetyltransferase [Planctomycetes bacterium]|nr:arylamine N-acetyltransferase [Planctomycetota bacterium]MCB9885985.1 arylamine N-acetyltransferase [Planctomycetota bacterium]
MTPTPDHPHATPDQLRRYLARVGLAEAATGDATAAQLAALHEAHLRAIPFENLEIHLGRPMRLEPEALFADLADRRRGGYCFQMNELFALVAAALGYGVERFAARVRFGNPMPMPPRSHQCLRITAADGSRWFCDVGFGGASPIRPLPWSFDEPVDQQLAGYVLTRGAAGEVVVRTRLHGGDWQDMIVFTEEVQQPIDFRYANFALSHMPDSKFVVSRIASRLVVGARLNFQDGVLRRITATDVTVEQLTPAAEEHALRGLFGLELPDALPWLAER